MFLFLSVSVMGQKYHLTGRIYDAVSNQSLTGANVSELVSGKGGVADQKGEYKISLNRGKRSIHVSFIGYRSIDTMLFITENHKINFYLFPEALEMQEATIVAPGNKDLVSSTYMGEIRLSQFEISMLPGLLGEADPIRFLQLTPGVQSGTEAGIGFYVRGGNVDQNLVLYNDATVYNPGHLMGFFSVFNPDVIKEVNLLKAGIPARFGQRLSSVIEVNSINGKSDSLSFKGEIGLVSSRLTIKNSFAKGKGSFFLSGRRTYLDLLIKPVLKPFLQNSSPFIRGSEYFFYDMNGGIDYSVGTNDHLSLSLYHGEDDYQFMRDEIGLKNSLNWGNSVVSLKWLHSFNEKLILNNSVSSTLYHFKLQGSQSIYSFEMNSSAKDLRYKSLLTKMNEKGKFYGGFELIAHEYIPNEVDVDAGNFLINFLSFNKLYAMEGAGFADVEHSWGKFSLSGGLRYSLFNQVGPYTEYIEDGNNNISDSVIYSRGESISFYHNLEPRLSLKYQLNDNSSLKASYMRVAQYVHLATSSSVSLPTDIWLPSSQNIKPQTGSQISMGYYRNFNDESYEASVELYYKSSRNQMEFIRGIITNSLNMTLDDNIAVGKGYSYGSEFYLRKKSGDLTGWISYTLSRTMKDFEDLNEGKIYPAKYDRRHDLSVALIQKLSKKWHASAVFIYVSGNALNIPVGRYIIQGNLMNEYDEVNSFRMPAYHRMDVSFTRETQNSKGRVSAWNFSIYNLYNRENPFYVYFETEGDIDNYTLQVFPELVSLFPIIPSVSWSFTF